MSKTRTVVEIVLFLALAGALAMLAIKGGEVSGIASGSSSYVTVNGYPIPQHSADTFIAELKARGAQTDTPDFQNAVREEMIRRGMLLSEAKKLGLDKTSEFKQQSELATQLLLMRNVVADYLQKNPVTGEELQNAYDMVIARLGKTEYKLRHIQVKTAGRAKNIVTQIGEGKDFAEIARESSLDETSKDKGGLLGWRSPYTLPGPIGTAIMGLKKGEFTKTPVEDQAGFHILLVEDVRPFNPPGIDELQSGLTQAVAQQKTAKYIADLREKAKVQ
jgi:peptidyl-prolyl cis-trans isomerase C